MLAAGRQAAKAVGGKAKKGSVCAESETITAHDGVQARAPAWEDVWFTPTYAPFRWLFFHGSHTPPSPPSFTVLECLGARACSKPPVPQTAPGAFWAVVSQRRNPNGGAEKMVRHGMDRKANEKGGWVCRMRGDWCNKQGPVTIYCPQRNNPSPLFPFASW